MDYNRAHDEQGDQFKCQTNAQKKYAQPTTSRLGQPANHTVAKLCCELSEHATNQWGCSTTEHVHCICSRPATQTKMQREKHDFVLSK